MTAAIPLPLLAITSEEDSMDLVWAAEDEDEGKVEWKRLSIDIASYRD
jgi:hypothetical protein